VTSKQLRPVRQACEAIRLSTLRPSSLTTGGLEYCARRLLTATNVNAQDCAMLSFPRAPMAWSKLCSSTCSQISLSYSSNRSPRIGQARLCSIIMSSLWARTSWITLKFLAVSSAQLTGALHCPPALSIFSDDRTGRRLPNIYVILLCKGDLSCFCDHTLFRVLSV
jgi:hypothetical protein